MTAALSNRQKKAQRKAIGTKPVSPAAPRRQPAPKAYQHDTGLSWLHHKKQITSVQKLTGERYGRWYRAAMLSDPASLRSCLNDTPRGAGSGLPSTVVEDTAAWINESIEKLSACRSAASNHAGLILALDLVCGRQLRPTEIMPDNQRGREEIVTSLRIALDMLEKVR